MQAPTAAANPEPGLAVLWNVVEEHLEEAAYALTQFQRSLESPLLTLQSLAWHPEASLLAHVDALLVAGPPALDRLIAPLLDEPDPAELDVITLAAWVTCEAGEFDALAAPLANADPVVRGAAARAARYCGGADLDAWIDNALMRTSSGALRSGLLEMAARRQLPHMLLACLQSDDAALVESAARAALYAEPGAHLPIMQDLLEHDSVRVREAALLACLSWGSQQAWQRCREWALDPAQPLALATPLYAALGGRADHAELAGMLETPTTRKRALYALGFSGNTALADTLFPYLTSEDALEAKLAFQGLALLFGFQPSDDAFAAPEPPDEDEPPPALEDDDLDADLVPPALAALPAPRAQAVIDFCVSAGGARSTTARCLLGRDFTATQLERALIEAPLATRHILAQALGVRSAGSLWIDTYALTRRQRAQVAGVGAITLRRHTAF
jgi:uncharacterized protein (TIGR02270 family)